MSLNGNATKSSLDINFERFDNQIRLANKELETALERTRKLRSQISQHPQVLTCTVTGSIARSTAIRIYSDIDLAVRFNERAATNGGPAEIIAETEHIGKSVTKNIQTSDGSVRLIFPDWPSVDLIPIVQDNTSKTKLLMPNRALAAWLPYTAGQRDIEINLKSNILGPKFTTLIRIMKWWDRVNDHNIGAYYIEQMALDACKYEMPSYPDGIVSILGQAAQKATKSSGSAEELQAAHDLAKKASFATRPEPLWKALFGEKFPISRP
ncbi:SMODS domain-containing nucleotidyltransferase [Acrocarpospora catenulata]|uniref:SMODS domain-containing nucleotidyltransferase n=1 Tax=Acrocarpospora catenulata TaxID=2836182 RepID=UPI001BD9EED1|nr:nucleotidyltransferase domain-containing protein [Acrocarpospora catenulata]